MRILDLQAEIFLLHELQQEHIYNNKFRSTILQIVPLRLQIKAIPKEVLANTRIKAERSNNFFIFNSSSYFHYYLECYQ